MNKLLIFIGIIASMVSCQSTSSTVKELELEYEQYIGKYKSVNNAEHFMSKLFDEETQIDRQTKTLELFEVAFTQRENWSKLVSSIDKFTVREFLGYYKLTYGDSKSYSKFQEIILSEYDSNVKLKTPNFHFKDENDNKIELADFAGKLIVIDFWATWCKPCLQLEGDYKKIVKKYNSDDSIIFLSIAVRQQEEKWRKHIKGNKENYPNLIDGIFENGEYEIPKGYFDLFSIPKFAFIGKDGHTIYSNGPQPNTQYFMELIDKHK